jgi:hypothetical protein
MLAQGQPQSVLGIHCAIKRINFPLRILTMWLYQIRRGDRVTVLDPWHAWCTIKHDLAQCHYPDLPTQVSRFRIQE